MEYVFSGSRLKLYLPKETCLITFLLAGECAPQVTPSVLPWSLKPSCSFSIPPNTGLWRIVGKTARKLTLLRWKEQKMNNRILILGISHLSSSVPAMLVVSSSQDMSCTILGVSQAMPRASSFSFIQMSSESQSFRKISP